jgi:hypothetical protein
VTNLKRIADFFYLLSVQVKNFKLFLLLILLYSSTISISSKFPFQIKAEQQNTYGPHHTRNAQMEQVTPVTNSSSYVSNRIHKRRIQRHLRHRITTNMYTLNLRQLPRQITTDPFANQLFNGTNFY